MGDMGAAGFDSAPLPQGDPSMDMMGGDPNAMGGDPMMGNDPNAMGGDPMIGGDEPQADGEVDNKAEQAAGTLSNILPNANASTADYAMKMVSSAIAKNPNVGKDDLEGYAERLTSGNEADDENADEGTTDAPPMQESRARINFLINKALNEMFGDDDKKNVSRAEKKRINNPMMKKDNPFKCE